MLVTNQQAPFFRQQVGVLEDADVECSTVAVPDREGGRTRRDYVAFYESVLAAVTEPYDLVHANYGLTAPAALAQPRRPVVVSLWGSDLFGTYGWLSAWCARRASGVIVMSQEMNDTLDAEAQVIPHGVDLETFRPLSRERARETVGWSREGVDVLFPYDPERGVKNYPRARRVLDRAGSVLDRPARLRVVTGVDHTEMPTYLNAADALLLTSQSEGSPNAVKEALACDTPVVATDVGDVAEYTDPLAYSGVETTDAGLADRLATLLRDAPVTEGRDQVRGLGLDVMRDRLLSVYASVLEEPVEVPADV
jgi:glycosyltransferase involved in cell wall biosynthesis